ncbi:HD domain-containing protein [uncultured Catenibacterium sp.]|uniref:HD domain-containing protein n=1 Tax=uncultured Catenibacterium sp. TaxID=286142 RepID=UPI0025FC6CB7|nr:HD domain-containing protein [uncultured Catenibacterium sp.]
MNLFSGHRIDPLHIKEDDIHLEDIAHALSLICRGNGHIKYFYSVAQHSLNCAKEAQNRGYSKDVVLSCLFHDASEAYMSDLITPIKKQMKEYQMIEDQLLEIIFQAFHIQLQDEEKTIWKEMDHLLLEAELKEMMPLEEDRPTVTLISVPDLKEHNYREIEEEFKAYALELLEDL